MKTKSKSLSILAAVAAMLANAIPASAAEVSYPGMTAAFDLSVLGNNTTGVIPLDPSGVFDGAYNHNGGNPIVTTRYYSGKFTTTYNHGAWAVDNGVTVNFILANGGNGGKFGIPNAGWGNIRSEFPDASVSLDSVAAPITLDYQIKLSSLEYNKYEIKVFTGPAATAATEGTPAYSNTNLNGPYVGSPLSSVSFTTTGVTLAGTASSSNFKSSDAWIPGAVVVGVVSDPYFTPVGGTYATAQSVSIASNTVGSTIHYTLDGTTPTTASATYTAPLTVDSTQTIKALAVKSGDTNSAITEASYTIIAATPVPDVAGGTYNTKDQTVTLSSATPGATLYYTLDGSPPDNTSTLYTAPITVSNDVTISAIAYFGAFDPSDVWVGTYTFVAGTPVLTPPAGSYATGPSVTLTSVTPGAAIYYTTDGNTPDETSTLYTAPIAVNASQTLSAVAVATGYANGVVAVGNYVIDPTVLAGWSFPTAVETRNPAEVPPYTLAAGLDSGITLARGAGYVSPGFYFAGTHFDSGITFAALSADVDAALTNGVYSSFILTPSAGKKVSVSELNFSVCANGGATTAVGEVVFSQDGFATYTSLGSVAVTNGMNGTPGTLNVSGVAALQNSVVPTEFRFCFHGANEYEIVGLGRNPSTGEDIILRGTVANTGGVDDYASWASLNGVTGGANGDSDNDGIKNLVEYALADGTRGTYTGGTYSFIKRGGLYGSDITYSIEESTDLSVWTPAASTQNATTISYVLTGGTKKFARLKVTQP